MHAKPSNTWPWKERNRTEFFVFSILVPYDHPCNIEELASPERSHAHHLIVFASPAALSGTQRSRLPGGRQRKRGRNTIELRSLAISPPQTNYPSSLRRDWEFLSIGHWYTYGGLETARLVRRHPSCEDPGGLGAGTAPATRGRHRIESPGDKSARRVGSFGLTSSVLALANDTSGVAYPRRRRSPMC